jgi:hypothetical protein
MFKIMGFLLLSILLIVFVLHEQHTSRIDGSEWRVRPSDSGKTWILYRSVGLRQERSNKRFKSRAAAEDFARSLRPQVQYGLVGTVAVQQPRAAPAAPPPSIAPPHDQEVARASALAADAWAKASASIVLTNSSSNYSIRISNLRLSKYYLDQVRRLKKNPGISIEIDTAEFESRLRLSALAILKFGGFSNPISQVRESPIGSVPAEVKVSVWSRDGGACIRCGAVDELRFDPDYSATSDDYDGAHLQLVCDPCFSKKSTWRKS